MLHAGMPKTGSSAIQHWLAANARTLRRHGILYPQAGRRQGGVEHNDLMRAIAGRPLFRGTETMPEALSREIRATPHEVLILSAEFLFGPLYFAPDPRIPAFLAAEGYELHGILYIRDQPDFLNSSYAQMVRTLREGRRFGPFLDQRLDRPRHPASRSIRLGRLLGAGAPAWGTQHFRAYSADLRRIGIEADFRAVLGEICAGAGLGAGLGAAEFVPAERRNEACGPVQIAVSRRLARDLAQRFDRKETVRVSVGLEEIVGAAIDRHGIAEPASYSGLTPERYARTRAALAGRNEAFARAVWNRGWAEIFPPRPEDGLVSNDLDDTGDGDLRARVRDILREVRPEIEAQIAARLARGLVRGAEGTPQGDPARRGAGRERAPG